MDQQDRRPRGPAQALAVPQRLADVLATVLIRARQDLGPCVDDDQVGATPGQYRLRDLEHVVLEQEVRRHRDHPELVELDPVLLAVGPHPLTEASGPFGADINDPPLPHPAAAPLGALDDRPGQLQGHERFAGPARSVHHDQLRLGEQALDVPARGRGVGEVAHVLDHEPVLLDLGLGEDLEVVFLGLEHIEVFGRHVGPPVPPGQTEHIPVRDPALTAAVNVGPDPLVEELRVILPGPCRELVRQDQPLVRPPGRVVDRKDHVAPSVVVEGVVFAVRDRGQGLAELGQFDRRLDHDGLALGLLDPRDRAARYPLEGGVDRREVEHRLEVRALAGQGQDRHVPEAVGGYAVLLREHLHLALCDPLGAVLQAAGGQGIAEEHADAVGVLWLVPGHVEVDPRAPRRPEHGRVGPAALEDVVDPLDDLEHLGPRGLALVAVEVEQADEGRVLTRLDEGGAAVGAPVQVLANPLVRDRLLDRGRMLPRFHQPADIGPDPVQQGLEGINRGHQGLGQLRSWHRSWKA